MADICGDNIKIISKAKEALIESTNIEESPKEMAVLNDFLFRCWQMGWLDKYDKNKADKQPTAYDIDKIVEQLEELIEKNVGFMRATPEANAYIKAIRDAIEIVKGGAE